MRAQSMTSVFADSHLANYSHSNINELITFQTRPYWPLTHLICVYSIIRFYTDRWSNEFIYNRHTNGLTRVKLSGQISVLKSEKHGNISMKRGTIPLEFDHSLFCLPAIFTRTGQTRSLYI